MYSDCQVEVRGEVAVLSRNIVITSADPSDAFGASVVVEPSDQGAETLISGVGFRGCGDAVEQRAALDVRGAASRDAITVSGNAFVAGEKTALIQRLAALNMQYVFRPVLSFQVLTQETGYMNMMYVYRPGRRRDDT